MSSGNVDSVRTWLSAFTVDVDAFRDTLHPDVEWFPFEENHTPSHGLEGAMRIRNQWLDAWDEQRVYLEDLLEEGDSVVASVHVTARGRASGAQVDVRLHFHFKFRDGKIVHIFEYEDRPAALQAAGLA